MKLPFLLGMLLSSLTAYAQRPATPTPEQLRRQMRPLQFLAGTWQGDGWALAPDGKKHPFQQTEQVQVRLDSVALLVQGLGRTPAGQPVHQALATLSYDAATATYRMRSMTHQGQFIDAQATPLPGGRAMQWGFAYPGGGQVRFTIRLTPEGHWHEVGEFSRDGQKWQQTLEMTLRRTGS